MSPTQIEFVPVDLIDPHPHNPRRDLGDLTEITASVRESGVLQNLTLVPQPDNPDRYWPVMGHRRLAAAKAAELDDVPAVVREDLSPAKQVAMMIAENVQRQDLSPVEEADAYQDMLDQGWKVRDIVKATGRSERTVTARLRLMKLPKAAREKVHLHEATLDDAAELDAFVGHQKLLTKVAGALGTSNFRWYLDEARRELKTAEIKKHIEAELKKHGIPHKPDGDSYAHNEWRDVARLTRVADLAKAVKAGLPDGAAWANTYGAIVIVRPTTEDERAGKSAQSEEWARQREFDDRIAAEGEQAWQARDQFIRGLLGRKRIAAKDTLLIVAVAAPIMLCDSPPGGTLNVSQWLGLQGYRSPDQVQVAIAEQFPEADPVCWLLVGLQMLSVRQRGWLFAHDQAATVALYGLLEHLGYPVSDAERARITAPDEDQDESEHEAVAS